MCGIAGIISTKLSSLERENRVRRIVARQRLRGPDSEGYFSSGPTTIGMCRLAIFDPAHGQQPMSTPDGRFHLVFNGAIYNHRELKAELSGLGWSFRTECDTEVLLAAYAQYGSACLPRLRGMFAFAAWDEREQSLFIARDALGVKPLYYSPLADGSLVFASEISAIIASGLSDWEIDPASVGEYLAWFAVPAPRTIYRGINNLPPGHALQLGADGRCESRRWWSLPEPAAPPVYASYNDFIAELRGQLDDSIRAHRLADVPVGAFLSGGLDSSAIVALMAANGASKLKTFSLVFNEAEYSEQEYARAAAEAVGADHHEEVLTGKRVANDLPRLLAALDQPTGDGVNTYYASLAARNGGVRVALSGLGGDEIFGGYPSFNDMPKLARILPFWRALPRVVREAISDRLRARGARSRKLSDILTHARDLHELCSLRRRALSETTRLDLLEPEARLLAERQGPNHPMLDDFVFELLGADEIQTVSAWEMRTYMADVLLRDSDVFSMAHSLELRVPFVDRKLVEWWWNQPRAYRHRPDFPKSALANAVGELLPKVIRTRTKRGFTLPFALWMRAELKPFLEDVFGPSSLSNCPWLNTKKVQREWRSFAEGGDIGNWGRVWTLAMLIGFANRKA